MTILLKIWLAETLLLASLVLLIGASNANAEDISYLCQFPQEWKPDHTFGDPDSPGTFYTCRTYANWVTGSGGGPTGVDASWTCAGTTQAEQYHVGTVSKFGCCGPSGRSACCSQIVTWRPGAEDECSPSPGPPPTYASPPPPTYAPPPPPTVVSYCLPRQDWQYHCDCHNGPEPYTGTISCLVAQIWCGGDCNTGHDLQGDMCDQCNHCLSNSHTGLDGSTTCDGTCTPGDTTDPCFKGYFSTTKASPPTTTSPPPSSGSDVISLVTPLLAAMASFLFLTLDR